MSSHHVSVPLYQLPRFRPLLISVIWKLHVCYLLDICSPYQMCYLAWIVYMLVKEERVVNALLNTVTTLGLTHDWRTCHTLVWLKYDGQRRYMSEYFLIPKCVNSSIVCQLMYSSENVIKYWYNLRVYLFNRYIDC